MNLIKLRFIFDRKMDDFVKENYDDIAAKDNLEDLESLFLKEEAAQT